MADKVFEPEVRLSLNRIADRFLMTKPLALECKKTEKPYLPFGNVHDHQIEALLAFKFKPLVKKLVVPATKAKKFAEQQEFDYVVIPAGLAFLLVNFRFTKDEARSDLPKGINLCFAITPEQYVEAKAKCKMDGRGSIPLEWFQENAISIDRTKFNRLDGKADYGWDLSVLLRNEH